MFEFKGGHHKNLLSPSTSRLLKDELARPLPVPTLRYSGYRECHVLFPFYDHGLCTNDQFFYRIPPNGKSHNVSLGR